MATSKTIEIAWMNLSQINLSNDKGPIAGYGQVDYSGGVTPQLLDFQYSEQKGLVSAIAGIFVDNADNPFPIYITLSGTRQRLIIPSLAQALLPLLSKAPEQISFDSPGSVAVVRFQFLNFRPGSPLVWGARSGGGSPSAPLYTSNITYNNMTLGNVVLGASAQIIPANALGVASFVKAPATNINPAFLNWGAAAAANTFMQLDPGDYLTFGNPGNYDPRACFAFGTAPDRISFGYA